MKRWMYSFVLYIPWLCIAGTVVYLSCMDTRKIIRACAIVVIMASNIGCDQVSKDIIRKRIADRETISFLHDHLMVMKVENQGSFLSIGHDLPQPLRGILLTGIPLGVLMLAFLYILSRTGLSRLTLTGACFILGGGFGNVYDRLMYGSVTDFLHIDFILFQTGIFNMADVSIMVGIGMIITDALYQRKNISDTLLP